MMSAMDEAVGRVLAKIRDMGQEEDTLIIFLSDNGGPTQQTSSHNGVLRGFKATTLEGGVRVPFCMQWKGKLPAGKVYEHPIIQLDVLPTCVNAAGGKIDPAWKLDGVDLLPYLTGVNKERPHETLYWRFGAQWAIRKGDYKLVVSRIDGPEARLFNLATDVGEAKDLMASEPKKAKELKDLYDAWNAEQAAPLWQPPAVKKKEKKKKKAEETTFERGRFSEAARVSQGQTTLRIQGDLEPAQLRHESPIALRPTSSTAGPTPPTVPDRGPQVRANPTAPRRDADRHAGREHAPVDKS